MSTCRQVLSRAKPTGAIAAHRMVPMMRKCTNLLFLLTLPALSVGCSSIPVDQRAQVREQLVVSGEEIKATFASEVPGLEQELAESAGYFTGRISGGKLIFGHANGAGVLVDNADHGHVFMNASVVDMGIALGGGTDRILVLLETREAFEEFRRGIRRFGFGATLGVGEAGTESHSFSEEGYRFLIRSETGAGITATAGMLNFSVNTDLTNAGVSDVSIPNTGFPTADKRSPDAPQAWNSALPFLAQKVIDKGYNLPLPYGAGLVFAVNEQEQTLTGLEAGVNGRDKVPMEFVTFDRALTTTDSLNAKVDAWLFPFLNIYATFGPFKGDADLDILLDGNGMIEHLGLSCDGPNQPRLCDRLQDQSFLLPIHTEPSGTSWGVGGVLAGGWKGWFVTIPFNYSRIDLGDTFVQGGPIITVTPRFGRNFVLGRLGNFALFAGGNYLKSKLEISGTYRVPVEDEVMTFDYTVQQKNKDAWNLLFGFNWDVNKQFSWNLEYDGFIGSREAVISSVTWRF